MEVKHDNRGAIANYFTRKTTKSSIVTTKHIVPELNSDWDQLLMEDWEDPKIQKLLNMVDMSSRDEFICDVIPHNDKLFTFLKETPYNNVRVVILGQDPYIHKEQANGLAFSVDPEVEIPYSLRNIYKEISDDVGCYIPDNGDLRYWAKQGVLLMNCCLTCMAGMSRSHQGKGWELLTDHIIRLINEKDTPVVYMLWGMYARAKKQLITNKNHLVLEAPHPSPLAQGAFFGCKHFSKCNDFFRSKNVPEIDWQIKNVKREH